MRNGILSFLVFLLFLSPGCTQTEESKASFGALFLLFLIAIIAIASLLLNLITLGIAKILKNRARKTTSILEKAIAGLSMISSFILLIAVFVNFLRCSGGCFNILGITILLILLSFVPGIIGFLRLKKK